MNNNFTELSNLEAINISAGGALGVVGGGLIIVGGILSGGGALVVGVAIFGGVGTIIQAW